MLPPLIPLSAAPVTTQFDPVKPQPAIAPVVPAQSSSGQSTINLKQERDPQEQALLLRDEQRRQQQRRQQPHDERFEPLPGDELNADDTVPVAPLMGDEPRQGLLVDIKI
ncbi:MAG TPA: aspartate-semialdehyde dehydrogenase [Pseudomonas sp.]|uniref:aspartate-semialdehyde dehydrogenase n=1 Tax=Pseudomonas sp. TaxID=306 RepID=UPI002B467D24|nr:aspartate-semialdehyde dehydrogenase [Pseudomonas sp.]HKS14401.1 aspartate-semialdehyde dehydrogenase [Pseudomonas sp.]